MKQLHVCVLFHNIGGYHAARLRASEAACRQRGWRLTAIQMVAATTEHPWGDLARAITFPLVTLPPADKTNSDAITPTLDQLRPDVLVLPGWGEPISRAALQWGQQHAIPAILMSESKRDDAPRQWWKERVKTWRYVRHFRTALVGGQLHREYAVELGIPADKVFLGYDVVDNEYFAAAAAAACRDTQATRAAESKIPAQEYWLSMTRFLPRKNVLGLLRAFAAYREQRGTDSWDLVICGSGEQEAEIKALMRELRLTAHVHLPGFVPYQALGRWYGLAQALIHPALQEQWGLVINEACAARLPILSSRTVGAAHELVRQGENGFLFDPENVADITRAMLEFQQLSPARRQELGAMSQGIIMQYGPEQFAAGLLQAIEAAGL